jgi:quercetin dioxygenase-like cupin family protein
MNSNQSKKIFIEDDDILWEQIDTGVKRKIISYDDALMTVKVEFETGGIGSIHKHYHSQITYIESGIFEVEIDGEKKVLKAGDSFYIPPNVLHGVVCKASGTLIDAFSPMREDFIK